MVIYILRSLYFSKYSKHNAMIDYSLYAYTPQLGWQQPAQKLYK